MQIRLRLSDAASPQRDRNARGISSWLPVASFSSMAGKVSSCGMVRTDYVHAPLNMGAAGSPLARLTDQTTGRATNNRNYSVLLLLVYHKELHRLV